MAPIKKQTIKAKKPPQKSVVPSKVPSKSKSIPPMAKLESRIQTGEGWRREKIRERKKVKGS